MSGITEDGAWFLWGLGVMLSCAWGFAVAEIVHRALVRVDAAALPRGVGQVGAVVSRPIAEIEDDLAAARKARDAAESALDYEPCEGATETQTEAEIAALSAACRRIDALRAELAAAREAQR